jgi:hypothetical protein
MYQLKHHISGRPAKQPEFMLKPNNVRATAVYVQRRGGIARGIGFGDRHADRRGKCDETRRRRHCIDVDTQVW